MKLSARRLKINVMKLFFSCNSQSNSETHCHRMLDVPKVKQGSKTGATYPLKSITTILNTKMLPLAWGSF